MEELKSKLDHIFCEVDRHYYSGVIEPLAGKELLKMIQQAIDYIPCCEIVKDKYTHTFEVDLNSDKLKKQHCEQMKQIHSAPTRLFMYDHKTEQYIEIKP